MKVLLVNGSPNREGCTHTALSEVAATLQKNGIETEMLYLGKKPLAGCIACGNCLKTGHCFRDDVVQEIQARLEEFDGLVIGSPVYSITAARPGSLSPSSTGSSMRRRGAWRARSALRLFRAAGAAPRPPSSSSTSISPSATCPSSRRSTGIRSMALRPTMCARTARGCRRCACWGRTWRGCSAASRADAATASRSRTTSRVCAPTSSRTSIDPRRRAGVATRLSAGVTRVRVSHWRIIC